MDFLQIILTILVAAFVGLLFYYIFKYTGPFGRLWTFILILVLAGLAAAAWIEPAGPVYWDVAWLPVIFVILLFALFLVAATPLAHREGQETEIAEPETSPDKNPQIALSAFFWLFLAMLLFIALWGILR